MLYLSGKVLSMSDYADTIPSLNTRLSLESDHTNVHPTSASPLFPRSYSIHDSTGLLDDGVGIDDSSVASLMHVSRDKNDKYSHISNHISVDSKYGALNHSSQDLARNTKTPWKEFFKTPAALTLLVAGWTNVSK